MRFCWFFVRGCCGVAAWRFAQLAALPPRLPACAAARHCALPPPPPAFFRHACVRWQGHMLVEGRTGAFWRARWRRQAAWRVAARRACARRYNSFPCQQPYIPYQREQFFCGWDGLNCHQLLLASTWVLPGSPSAVAAFQREWRGSLPPPVYLPTKTRTDLPPPPPCLASPQLWFRSLNFTGLLLLLRAFPFCLPPRFTRSSSPPDLKPPYLTLLPTGSCARFFAFCFCFAALPYAAPCYTSLVCCCRALRAGHLQQRTLIADLWLDGRTVPVLDSFW